MSSDDVLKDTTLTEQSILDQIKETTAKLCALIFDLDRLNEESLILPEDEHQAAMHLVGNVTFAIERTVTEWQKKADERAASEMEN